MDKITTTLAYYLSILTLGLFTALIGPALPSLAGNTSSSLDQISLIFIFGSLGYILGSFLGGQLIDRVSGHRLLALTLLGVALSGAWIPVVHQLWWLLLAQFILGTAQGANDVGCNTLLLWTHGEEAGPYINGLHFCFGLGSSIAPLVLAGFLFLTGKIHWAFWIFSLLCIPLLIWLWGLPEIPPEVKHNQKRSQTLPYLPLIVFSLAFLVYVGAEVGFGSWIYTYALTVGLGTTISAAYLTSAFWGTFTAGRLLGVWTATRLPPLRVLTIDLLGGVASICLILFFPESRSALWMGTIGIGIFLASVFPTLLLVAEKQLPITGTVTGWFLVGGGLGGMILPWLIGKAFVDTGPSAMPSLILGALALTGVIVFFSSRNHKVTNT